MAKTSRKCALHPVPPLNVRCTCHASMRAPNYCDSGSGSATRAPARAPFIRFFLLAFVVAVTFRCTLLTALIRGSEAAPVHQPGHPRYVRLASDARCISIDFEQKCSAPPPSPSGSNARRGGNGSSAVLRDPVWRGVSPRVGGNPGPVGPLGPHHWGLAGVEFEGTVGEAPTSRVTGPVPRLPIGWSRADGDVTEPGASG